MDNKVVMPKPTPPPVTPIEREPVFHGDFIGVDVGQVRDFSAVVTLSWITDADGIDQFGVTQAERFALGTKYGDLAKETAGLADYLKKQGRSVVVGIDATGVGAGVTETFQEAFHAIPNVSGVKIIPCVIHGGFTEDRVGAVVHVPKRSLIYDTTLLLGRGQLHIPKDLDFHDILLEELHNYAAKTNIATGNVQYEAWKENIHDDLVFALAIDCHLALKQATALVKQRGRVIAPVKIEKGDYYSDPTKRSAMHELSKRGRWVGFGGFREGFKPP